MNEKNFTVIEDWMLNLGLNFNELIVFATIYSFSKGDAGIFSGRLEYFVERFHIARRTLNRIMRSLEQKGLIIKEKGILSGLYARCNSYSVNNDIISQYMCQNGPTYVPNCPNTSGQNGLTYVPNCPNTLGQNGLTYVPNCPNTLGQNGQSIYNKEYNKEYSKEYNKKYNTISPNGESESDIVESENGDECYCESDNSQIELSFGDDIADNNINNADTAKNKKSAGSKKKDTKAGTKSKKAQEAGQDFRAEPPSRELASQKNNKNRAQESEQNSRAEPPSRELSTQKNNKSRVQEKFDKFWAAYPRHIDKAKALKAFTKINPDDELLERMLNTINEAKKTKQWQTPQYIPYPTTWLNGSRWEDEIDPKEVDYDIAHPHSLDNPTDRAVANGENPFASDDWW